MFMALHYYINGRFCNTISPQQRDRVCNTHRRDFSGLFETAVFPGGITRVSPVASEKRQTVAHRGRPGAGQEAGRIGGRPKLVLDRDQVRRLREEGKSLREISDQMGLSLTTTVLIMKTA